MQVKDIMTKDVITVKPETKISEVADLLFNKNLTGLPVVENNKVVGIVAEADLVTKKTKIHIPSYICFLDVISCQRPDKKRLKKEKEKIAQISVRSIMTTDVVTVNPETEVKDLARLLSEKRVNPVPVVEKSSGDLVGIVSRADLVKILWKV